MTRNHVRPAAAVIETVLFAAVAGGCSNSGGGSSSPSGATPPEAGTYPCTCTLHPYMTGSFVVR
ncbi:hypothetical protein [Streptomyces sp. NPDC093149]|uniref:hypothetical protein n=1 Tax=Streptomyces sp. NPDC093149 TaxID=3366031 RepID=UPI00382999BD